MFWSYENDPTGELLNAVNDGLNTAVSSQGEIK